MKIKQMGLVIYLTTLIGFLEFCAIKSGVDGVALATAIGGICFLAGLLFDVGVARLIAQRLFKLGEVKHEKEKIT